jgi:hypothetical protein
MVSADQEILVDPPVSEDTPVAPILAELAQDAWWLLNHRPPCDRAGMRQEYWAILKQQGYMTQGDHIRHRALVQACYARVPREVLTLLQCELGKPGKNWLALMLQAATPRPYHPLYHLLLLRMLGQSIQTLERAGALPSLPFGEGPWPCLNPVCPSFRQRCISTSTKHARNGQPVATFLCVCGYAYSRVGPDHSPADHYRAGRVAAYGPFWQQSLTQYWNDPTLSLEQISIKLRTTRTALRRQALLLHLPFAPEAPWRGPPPFTPADQVEERRAAYRATWLRVQAASPTAWLSQLVRQEAACHRWLQRHDSVWLHQHLPREPEREYHKEQGRREQIQTALTLRAQERDRTLAAAIHQAAQRLREYPGLPVRIRSVTISQELGTSGLRGYARLPAHLTQARQTLAEATESLEQYVARKVEWAVHCFQEEQQHPSRREIFQRAKVHRDVLQQPSIRARAEAIYASAFGGTGASSQNTDGSEHSPSDTVYSSCQKGSGARASNE